MSSKLKLCTLFAALWTAICLTSCASLMPASPSKVLFKEPPSSLAQFAVDNLAPNKKIQVLRDTVHPAQPIEIPFYSHCKENTLEISASIANEVNDGAHYVTERTCGDVDGDYEIGFVFVLTQDYNSSDQIWVSCPAILRAGESRNKITVAKEYITLNKKGDGEYLFIQK